jgi:hypothetical protein
VRFSTDRGADDIVDGLDVRQLLKRRTELDQSAPGVWREETVQVRIELSLDVLPSDRVLGAPAPVQDFVRECPAVIGEHAQASGVTKGGTPAPGINLSRTGPAVTDRQANPPQMTANLPVQPRSA